MTIHKWFAPTDCPGEHLHSLHYRIAHDVNLQLLNGEQEEEEVTQEQFNEMMNIYLTELAKQPPSDWSAGARAWAEGNGLIQGGSSGEKMYKKFCTREELM